MACFPGACTTCLTSTKCKSVVSQCNDDQAHEQSWEAAGQVLVAEEQQAAAKAAAKRAKKLRQKASKQQAAAEEPTAQRQTSTLRTAQQDLGSSDLSTALPELSGMEPRASSQHAVAAARLLQGHATGSLLQQTATAAHNATGSAASNALHAMLDRPHTTAIGGVLAVDQQASAPPVAQHRSHVEAPFSTSTADDADADEAGFLSELFCCPITQVTNRASPLT